MYIRQCDRCKQPVELKEELKHNGFLCNSCYLLWMNEEKKYTGKIGSFELRRKFINFVNFEANLRNTTLK